MADAAKHYVGVNVEWEGKLKHLSSLPNGNVRVMAFCEGSFAGMSDTTCTVESTPGLGLMSSGAHVKIRGKIASVDRAMVELVNATIESI